MQQCLRNEKVWVEMVLTMKANTPDTGEVERPALVVTVTPNTVCKIISFF